MNQAEGVFKFSPEQGVERLTIFVSPRYKSMDDLLISALLSHEMSHIINYVVGQMNYEPISCFIDEAQAFQSQNWFLLSLNEEERRSLLARAQVEPSPELVSMMTAFINIPKMKGATYQDKALNYVKSNPFYQEQCAQN